MFYDDIYFNCPNNAQFKFLQKDNFSELVGVISAKKEICVLSSLSNGRGLIICTLKNIPCRANILDFSQMKLEISSENSQHLYIVCLGDNYQVSIWKISPSSMSAEEKKTTAEMIYSFNIPNMPESVENMQIFSYPNSSVFFVSYLN